MSEYRPPRRRFMADLAKAALGLALAPRAALAIGDKTQLRLGLVRLPEIDPARGRGALERLAWELNLRTSVDSSYEVLEFAPDDPAMFRAPFLFLTGAEAFAPLSPAAIANLRRHLEFGGTLLVDDAAGHANSAFDQSFRREAARLFPDAPLSRLDDQHSIFRAYYLLRRLGGRVVVSPFLEGCTLDDHAPLIYCRNDLAGAWSRDARGRWTHDCVPGGEAQRQQAFALGVNAVLYALTVNYKQDQIHLPFIRERMRH